MYHSSVIMVDGCGFVYECAHILLMLNNPGDVYPFKLPTLQIW